jgi:hypothetical protein
MQDYPKLLDNGDRVGFTQIDRKFCFTTCKNDLKVNYFKNKDRSPKTKRQFISGVCRLM